MKKEEILARINVIFVDAFDNEDLVIDYTTTAKDVTGWDSLMQMTLIEMIEDEFGIRFKMSEVSEMKDIGDMIDIIIRHI